MSSGAQGLGMPAFSHFSGVGGTTLESLLPNSLVLQVPCTQYLLLSFVPSRSFSSGRAKVRFVCSVYHLRMALFELVIPQYI